MRHDAALADIWFANPALGWAVGNHGVIWHTVDSGATWQQQQSNTTCSLTAVYFVDARRGWVVGGSSRPLQPASRGVVLRTDDGGQTWSTLPLRALPRLAGVKFFDHEQGVVFGEATSNNPSGVFATRDGGGTWQPLAADNAGSWFAGDFLAADLGAVAGYGGRLATLNRQKVVRSPLVVVSQRAFHAIQLVAPTGGWAVGDGGLVMSTRDAGRSWQTPPTDLPAAVTDNFDFYAVAANGSHVWVAGAPGSRVFHSPDNGQSWESQATGHNVPLRSLAFLDARRGWAAGELGTILATHDGGATWQVQRRGGKRAALLALLAEPTDVPLELLAATGAAEGYIVATDVLFRDADTGSADSTATVGRVSAPQRSADAFLLAGAAATATAWRFPLPPADLAPLSADLLQELNRQNDGRAIQQLERHLVRELRMWRPDVVLTHHDPLNKSSPLAAFVEQLVVQAVASAADPDGYREMTLEVGLTPWPTKKVYGVLSSGSRGDELLATGRFSPWLGAALSDYVAPSRHILFAEHHSPPDAYELKLLRSTSPGSTAERGIFSGITLAPDSDARRPTADLPTQDMDALRRLATRRRHLGELLERAEGNAAWAGQVTGMVDGLGPDDAAQLLAQLAAGYRQTGRLDLAADTYFLLARRYPDHALADAALEWLIHFYASSETTQRLTVSNGLAAPIAKHATREQEQPQPTTPIQPASATLPATSSATPNLTGDDRLRRAVQLADYLRQARPELYGDLAIRFAEITAHRGLGFANPAERFYLTLRHLPDSDPWRACAAAEEWLAHPNDSPPSKKLATCRPTSEPPELNGRLDEPCWSEADRLWLGELNANRAHSTARADRRASPPEAESSAADRTPDHNDSPAIGYVQLSRDAEYLYVAIRCPKVAACDYTTDDQPRPRDADLTLHDRVTLRFDTDRDYTTAFELSIDHRGWMREVCWGDVAWNPEWFVAAAGDNESWTIEAAIPFAELVDKPPAVRQVWAVSALRTIPRVGHQSWSDPPGATVSPAQFGLLIFP